MMEYKEITQQLLKAYVEQHWEDKDYFEKTKELIEEFDGFWQNDNVYNFDHKSCFPHSEELIKFIEFQGMFVFKVELFKGDDINWFIFPSSLKIKKLNDRLAKMYKFPNIYGFKVPDIQSLGQNENYKPVFCVKCFVLTDNGKICRSCKKKEKL